MANKINNYLSLTHECNILHNIVNTMKHAKSKDSHYSLILQGCMNTRSGRAKFRKIIILFDSGSSSIIVMFKF